MVLDELSRKPEAKDAMEMAVKIDPKYPEALYYLGRWRAEANDPKARDAFEKYLVAAPKGAYAEEARQFIDGKARPAQPKKKAPKGRFRR
jgi:cytochrome c-type biogenesis protein CcmH/NrfG